MKIVLISIILLLPMCCHIVAQPCTEAIAESQATVCSRKNNESRQITYNSTWGIPTAIQVDDGIKRGDYLFSLFKPFFDHIPGFTGYWYPIVHDKTPEGLFYSSFTLELPRTGCKKEGGFRPLNPSGFGVRIMTNSLSHVAQKSTRKPLDGEKDSKTDYLDGSAVYMLSPREPNASFNGYAYYFKNVSQKGYHGVVVAKSDVDFFIPVTVRQYLQIQRLHHAESLADEQKKFAKQKAAGLTLPTQTWDENLKSNAEEYERLRVAYDKYPDGRKSYDAEMANKKLRFEKEQQKLKTVFEDAHTFIQTMYRENIQAIDDFIATTEADFLNKPCITNFPEISKADVKKSSFYDQPWRNANEWVIINPAYLNKNLAATVPQFFTVWWLWENYSFSLKGVETFEKHFDFKNLEAILGK